MTKTTPADPKKLAELRRRMADFQPPVIHHDQIEDLGRQLVASARIGLINSMAKYRLDLIRRIGSIDVHTGRLGPATQHPSGQHFDDCL
jgi:hypothetical protein